MQGASRMLSRRISIKSTVDNAFPAGPRQDTEKIDSGKPVTFSGTSAVLPSKRLSAPSAWADGDQFGHKVDILSDSTNKRGDESVGGWVTGTSRRQSVIKKIDTSPVRTPPSRGPVKPSKDATAVNMKAFLESNWVESPSPVKPGSRMPRLEADGTLVFSDDDADSPYKAPQRHSVIIRSRHDKTLHRVVALSPQAYTKKASPVRPCIISPEASAVRNKGSRWQRAPQQAPPASGRSSMTPSEASSISHAVDTAFDGENLPECGEELERSSGDESVTMGAAEDDWDHSAKAKPRLSVPNIFIPPAPGTFIRCSMERKATGIDRLQPKYFLYLETPRGLELVAMAKKKAIGPLATHWLFDTRGLPRDCNMDHLTPGHSRYIGKICSVSKKSSAYVIVGKGKPLKRIASVRGIPAPEMLEALRPEFGAVCFTLPTIMQKLKHEVGPRTVIALLPPPQSPPVVSVSKDVDAYGNSLVGETADERTSAVLMDAARVGFKTLEGRRCLASRILEKRYEPDMSLLVSKEPTLCNGVFQLNFGGRVRVASIKNFQLVDPDDTSEVLLQFGKTSSEMYSLDFKQPYTIVQAFGLALCQFIA